MGLGRESGLVCRRAHSWTGRTRIATCTSKEKTLPQEVQPNVYSTAVYSGYSGPACVYPLAGRRGATVVLTTPTPQSK